MGLYPNRSLSEVLFPRARFFNSMAAEDFRSRMLLFFFLKMFSRPLSLIKLRLGFAKLESWWTDAADVEQHLA